jgi:2-dehydro-3-deoxygluconokinase
VIYAGAEANVAIALANLNIPVDFVTILPENELGDACINYIRQFGVTVDKIIRTQDRLGLYFVETGSGHRGNKVIYDRANSAFANIKPKTFDWPMIFTNTQWFHWTGIIPAISKGAAEACLEAVKNAKDKGLTISCDVNYRGKLWKWGESPEKIMSELLEYVDVLICNEEDAEKVFGIKAPDINVSKGEMEANRYRFVTEKLKERFPNLQLIAITLRQSISANYNKWSGVLYDGKKFYISPNYDITHIVDRVGAGDVFAAGLIYMLLHNDDKQKTLDFAVAISCLKHTLYGDSCVIKIDEVEKLIKGLTTGRISR